MNVANWMSFGGNLETLNPAVQPATSLAQSGLAGKTGTSSFATMFSMQLGGTLLQMEPALFSELPSASASEDETEAQLELLLSLLQEQLLSSGWIQQDNSEQLHDQAHMTAQMGHALQSMLEAGNLNRQNLMTSFMQQGLSQQQASELAELLTTAANQGKQTDSKSQNQANQQFAQLLNEWNGKATNQEQVTRTTGLMEQQAKSEVKGFDLQSQSGRSSTFQQAQPMRVNHALNMYQLESASYRPQQVVKTDLTTSALHLSEGEQDHPVLAATQLNGTAQGSSSAVKPFFAGTHQVPADQFTQTVSNMFVKQLKLTQLQGMTEAKLVLNPRSLGQIDVRITSQDGVITAQFSANTLGGKELLDTQLAQLRAALVHQGLQVDRLEVTHQQNQEQRNDLGQQKEHERQQQPGSQQQQQQNADEQTPFSFESLLENEETMAGWNQRRAGTISYSV